MGPTLALQFFSSFTFFWRGIAWVWFGILVLQLFSSYHLFFPKIDGSGLIWGLQFFFLQKMDWWGLTWGQVWARCSSSSAASGANDRPLFTHRPPPLLLFPSTHLVFPWSLVYAKNYISRFSAVKLLESPCPPAAYLLVRSLTGDFGVGRTWFILNPTVDSVLLFSDPAPKINHTLTSKPPISVAISSEILASALGRGQYLVWNLNLLSIDMGGGQMIHEELTLDRILVF